MSFCNLHLLQILHRQNHNAQHHQNHADDPVERLRLRFVRNFRGNLRDQQRERHAQRQCPAVRQSADGEVADRARQRRERHDEHACANGGFQLVAHDGGQNQQHHHAAARADEAANHADERAADDRLHHALLFAHVLHGFARRHHRADDELDAQQHRHQYAEAAHRSARHKACDVAAYDRERQHRRHHQQAVANVEILVLTVCPRACGTRQHVARQRNADRLIRLHAQERNQHRADDRRGAHARESCA